MARAHPRSSLSPARIPVRHVLLVFVGGFFGTGARAAIAQAVPPVAGVPLAILGINVAGSFLLGLLLEGLARIGPDSSRLREIRLLLGTGVLGGFTTYSAFMTGTLSLWADAPVIAVAYAVGSLTLGLAAAALGLRLGRPRAGGAS